MKQKIVRLAVVCFFSIASSLFIHAKAHSFPNFDECQRFFDYANKKIDTFSLDERNLVTNTHHGFTYTVDENGSFLIEKVHPLLVYNFRENGKEIRPGDQITSINDMFTNSLSESEFATQFDKESLKINLNNGEEFEFQKIDLSTFDLGVAVDFLSISDIDSKNSNIVGSVNIQNFWYDERLSEIGQNVMREASEVYPDAINSVFYCDVPTTIASRLEIPSFEVTNFIPVTNPKQTLLRVFYVPKAGCESESCTELEKKHGIVRFERTVNFSGSFTQNFNLRKFPFDSQSVHLNISSRDNSFWTIEDQIHHTNLRFGPYSEEMLQNSVAKLKNDSWRIHAAKYEFGSEENIDIASALPTLRVGFEIERQYLFYIFKIFSPIFFILMIAISSVWIAPKELESRITLSIVCLLSLIAYNYIIDQDIPKLGYLTYLDKLVFISYIYAGIPTLQTVFIHHMLGKRETFTANKVDEFFRFGLPLSFVVAILVTTIYEFS